MTLKELTHDEQESLLNSARQALQRAYARYSNFRVGAAVLTEQGEIFTGCNVENISYGLTICAERAAIFSAIASGCRDFDCLVIATSGGVSPCGACRQVLAEFNAELVILLVDIDQPETIKEVLLSQLL